MKEFFFLTEWDLSRISRTILVFFFFFFFTDAGLGTSVDTVVLLFAPQIRARRGNGVGNDFTLHFMREKKSLFLSGKNFQSQERCNQDRHNYFLLKCRQGSNHMMNTIRTFFFSSQLNFIDEIQEVFLGSFKSLSRQK